MEGFVSKYFYVITAFKLSLFKRISCTDCVQINLSRAVIPFSVLSMLTKMLPQQQSEFWPKTASQLACVTLDQQHLTQNLLSFANLVADKCRRDLKVLGAL